MHVNMMRACHSIVMCTLSLTTRQQRQIRESSLCARSYNVGIEDEAVERLNLSKRTTRTTLANYANGINKRRLILEHSLHCDVPRARLSPGRQAPHNIRHCD